MPPAARSAEQQLRPRGVVHRNGQTTTPSYEPALPKIPRERRRAAALSPSTCASCRSIAPGFHRPLSFRIDDADARKPWLVMSLFVNPIRRKAAFMVFSDMQRATDRTEGNRNRPCSVSLRSSMRIETARGASGTLCGLRIFMRPAGTSQMAASRSNSAHSAARNSPGRTNVKARSSRAHRVSIVPS